VIVGLGNPEPQYADTPHNVGYAVVDRIAATAGLSWTETRDAWVARGHVQGRALCLVKVRTPMNGTGPGLRRIADEMGFSPTACVLVHDDLDLPIGSVRTRMHGGAGGHRGVASILEAFQSDAFRRVKIGIGSETAKRDTVAYVLSPFDPAHRASVERAIEDAYSRALDITARGAPEGGG
jgi:PTH1 family peptidyl-tRNA hydrolase